MNEWTGEADEKQMSAIQAALNSTIPGILEELEQLEKDNGQPHQ